jgi:hypothetical protein
VNPSPAAVNLIRSEVSDWSPSDPAIVAELNTPSIPNPTSRGTVPVPLSVAAVLGALSQASIMNLFTKGSGIVPTIRDDLNAQDRNACALWAQGLAESSIITSGELGALQAVLTATQLDPSWPAQISWAQANLGRPVDAADVAAARPNS